MIAVLLLVSVFGTPAQEANINQLDYEFWSGLTVGEKMVYVDGVIAGSYALALVFMGENPGYGGPDLFGYALLDTRNVDLVSLVDMIYRERRFRTAPVVAILINHRKWEAYIGGL